LPRAERVGGGGQFFVNFVEICPRDHQTMEIRAICPIRLGLFVEMNMHANE